MSQITLTLRGQALQEDYPGNIRLNEIWVLAGSPKNKRPNDWKRGASEDLVWTLWERVTGNSRNSAKSDYRSVYYASQGKGTFAHPVLAAAYAGYLDSNLQIEMMEVWLRYRAGDASLAEEILGKASGEANKWHDTRDVSKQVRNKYTSTLCSHGAKSSIGYCTDAIYIELLGGTNKQLIANRKLPAKTNLRDTLQLGELLQTMSTEYLAAERIEETNPFGKEPCAEASRRAARFVKEAFELERADRKLSIGTS